MGRENRSLERDGSVAAVNPSDALRIQKMLMVLSRKESNLYATSGV